MSYEYYFVCNNSFMEKVVHHKDCMYLLNDQKKFLGSFFDYAHAVATARNIYHETDKCQACLELQHKADASIKPEPTKKILISGRRTKARQPEKPVSDLKEKATAHINRVPRKHS